MAVWSSVRLAALSPGMRLDAEHYRPDYLLAAKRTTGGDPMTSVASEIIHPVELTREYDETGLPVVLAQDIRPTGLRVSAPAYMPVSVRPMLARSKLEPGDVLVTRSGANFGDVAPFVSIPAGRDEYYACADCLIVRPKEITGEYLAAFLGCAIGRSLMSRGGYGAGQPHIAPSYLWTLRIPRAGRAEEKVAALVRDSWSMQEQSHASTAAAESLLMEALGLDRLDLTPQTCYSRRFRDLQAEARFDAEYFNPKYQRIIKKLRTGDRTLADVAPLAERSFNPTLRPKGSTFRYIEIGSLTGDGEAEAETLDVADAPSRASWIVRPGDIITSTVRPVRRLSALVGEDQDGYVCSSGFAVLTPKAGQDGIEPEVLLTYLRLPIICEILDLHCTASMYPAIPVDRLMRIPIAVPDAKARKAIVAKVQEAAAARRDSRELLEKAKAMVEDLIAGGSRGKV